jgi:hypothetical protein
MPGEALYVLFGLWALAMLVVFVQATRLSYRIEARSPDLTNRSGVPRKAMLFHTITNLKVSRAVAELERRRWLTRTADESDRRVEHLALTKAGLAAYREMVPLAKAFERELLERLSVEERAAIVKGVAALERALSDLQ